MKTPFIVGLGGTPREGSATERALCVSLTAAEAEGAQTAIVAGKELVLPMYVPGSTERSPKARRLVDLFRRADGFIIATPAYHGSVSGLVKNALDYTEDLRADQRVYFDGCPVGCISCAGGWQGAGQTIAALRAITHSLRGWPTPFGAMINTSMPIFNERRDISDESVLAQLNIVGHQVVEFARMRLSNARSPRSPKTTMS